MLEKLTSPTGRHHARKIEKALVTGAVSQVLTDRALRSRPSPAPEQGKEARPAPLNTFFNVAAKCAQSWWEPVSNRLRTRVKRPFVWNPQ